MSLVSNIHYDDFVFSHSFDQFPNPDNYKMHTHEANEICVLISGKGIFHVEGTPYPLKSGDLIIMRAAESHYIEIDTSIPYERIVINFNDSVVKSIDSEGLLLKPFYDHILGKNNLYPKSSFKTDLYIKLFKNIISESQHDKIQILTMLFAVLNEIRNSFYNSEPIPQPDNTISGQIIAYINERLEKEISLEEICSEFFISKSQLCRIFKQSTGSTVWEYITIKRLINAKQLILSGTSPTKAAALCGFNDYSSFFRAYKKHFSSSPKETKINTNLN